MSFIERAKPLVERGYSIIPIEPNGKKPMAGIGATKRTRDLALVESWASQFPDANVGIVADENIVILESDDWENFSAKLMAIGKDMPLTATACGSSTTRPHFFFKRTEKASNVGNLAVPGLFEARFSNQYVVGAGSIHPSGAVYRWLNDVEPVAIPDWLVSELVRLASTTKGELDKTITMVGDKVPEGSRHYFLMRQAGRMWTGKISEEEFVAALQELNLKHCEPPRTLEHIVECVRAVMAKDPYDSGPEFRIGGKKAGFDWQAFYPEKPLVEKSEFIVPPTGPDGLNGWVVRGEVNLVVGSSGSGKSTFMYRMLEDMREGREVLKHPAAQTDYRILLHDRSEEAFRRTARRLRLHEEALNRISFLSRPERAEPVQTLYRRLKGWEQTAAVPDIVFIEGLDMWVPNADVNNFNVVQNFLTDMQEAAKMWNVAIIGSVGSPKQKAKDHYTLHRDQVMGTVAWGRKAETILLLELVDEEDPNSARKMTVLLRDAAAERFKFKWVDGRLEPVEETEEEEKEPLAGTQELQKVDRQSQVLSYIESLPVGTIVVPKKLNWFHASPKTIQRDLDDMCDPVSGVLTLDDSTRSVQFIVTKQRQQPQTAKAEN